MKKIDPFETLNDGEWLLVHSGAVTNTNPGSLVEVRLNTERICPNMTNAEFREIVMIARDRAIPEIRTRIDELHRWTPQNQSEVKRWFGRADETTRARLTHGLIECIRVLNELTPYNFTRHDSERFKHIGCVPNINKEFVSAEVCAPDTATHAIAIHRLFCELPTFSWRLDSMSSVLFHESTHFSDTFGSFDHEYGLKKILDSRYGEKILIWQSTTQTALRDTFFTSHETSQDTYHAHSHFDDVSITRMQSKRIFYWTFSDKFDTAPQL